MTLDRATFPLRLLVAAAFRFAAALILLLPSLLPLPILAAPGDLDPTFGPAGTGVVRTGFGNGVDEGRAVAYQPDGKFVVAGTSRHGDETKFSVVRYQTDGTLDPTFGQGGHTNTDFGLLHEDATAVVRQLDGKIVVAGTGNSQRLLLARFHADGTIDPTFSGDGRVMELVTPGIVQEYVGMVLQADGKILVCGSTSGDFVIVRYNTDGTRDTSFDGGVVRGDIYETTALLAVGVQLDGMILGVGHTSGSGQTQSMAVVRLNPNGSFDPTFSGDGKVTIAAPPNLLAGNALSLQISPASSKILVAGSAYISGTVHAAVARLNPDGSLDTTFGSNGVAILPLTTGNSVANAIRVLYSGGNPSRIYIAGDGSSSGNYSDMIVAKLHLGGALDTTFDGDGIAVISLSPADDAAAALMLNNSNKVLAVGHAAGPPSTDLATVLLNSNGALDTGWDQDGKRRDNFSDQRAGATSVAIQPDGKIVAGGFTQGASARFALARYSADGTLDPTFDGDGRSLPDIGDMEYSEITAMTVLPNGTILTAGIVESAVANDEFAVARFEPNGALDFSFGEGGILLAGSDNPNVPDHAFDLAIQPDQKILVAGEWHPTFSLSRAAVLRVLSDGIVDTHAGDGAPADSRTIR